MKMVVVKVVLLNKALVTIKVRLREKDKNNLVCQMITKFISKTVLLILLDQIQASQLKDLSQDSQLCPV